MLKLHLFLSSFGEDASGGLGFRTPTSLAVGRVLNARVIAVTSRLVARIVEKLRSLSIIIIIICEKLGLQGNRMTAGIG